LTEVGYASHTFTKLPSSASGAGLLQPVQETTYIKNLSD